jgi:hypothetical protein
VGSNPTGYERGSERLGWERSEDEDDAKEEVLLLLLLLEEVEKVDVIDRRERHDEADEVVVEELTVLVDIKDKAAELRRESRACENMRWIRWGGCLASRASMCRMDSSGISTLSSMVAVEPRAQMRVGVERYLLHMPTEPRAAASKRGRWWRGQ